MLPEVPTTFFTIALLCLKMKYNELAYYELVKFLPEFSTSFISEEDFVDAISVNVDVDVGTCLVLVLVVELELI